MATTFKSLGRNDIISTKTLLHENIPLTGTIVSGTYADNNIKNYAHGMFQSTFDYPYLSSSANHIFDVTMGMANDSAHSGSTVNHKQISKKINLYNQMAQMLVGYDTSGNILKFDADGDILAGGAKMREVMFMNFSRLLVKDEIKKGSFSLTFETKETYTGFNDNETTISDASGENDYRVNSPAGEYGILYATGNLSTANYATTTISGKTGDYMPCGLLFYQAGIAVLTCSLFADDGKGGMIAGAADIVWAANGEPITSTISGSNIQANADGLRHRMKNLTFNNTTELNSTIYFCRINHNEYNYSANPTYLSASQIRVKNNASDTPVAYITTVGLYSPDNQLLAVGKLSEPLRKDPTIEYTLRARLDY